MMFLLRMLLRSRARAMDPLQVSMTGVRMGERFLQIGCHDRALLSGLAAKVGLAGPPRRGIPTRSDTPARRREDRALIETPRSGRAGRRQRSFDMVVAVRQTAASRRISDTCRGFLREAKRAVAGRAYRDIEASIPRGRLLHCCAISQVGVQTVLLPPDATGPVYRSDFHRIRHRIRGRFGRGSSPASTMARPLQVPTRPRRVLRRGPLSPGGPHLRPVPCCSDFEVARPSRHVGAWPRDARVFDNPRRSSAADQFTPLDRLIGMADSSERTIGGSSQSGMHLDLHPVLKPHTCRAALKIHESGQSRIHSAAAPRAHPLRLCE